MKRIIGSYLSVLYEGNPYPNRYVEAGGQIVNRVDYPELAALAKPYNDAKLWQSAVLPENIRSVSAGNGVFVALPSSASSRKTYTSTDGLDWVAHANALPAATSWNVMTFGAGVFVAFRSTSVVDYATSTDGINWTPRVFPVAFLVDKCLFDGTTFLVLRQSTGTVGYTSTDGINWSVQTITIGSAAASWAATVAIPGGHGFFCYNAAGPTAGYSADGSTWAVRQILPNGLAFSFGASPTAIMIFTGNAGGYLWRSTDYGATWTVFSGRSNLYAAWCGNYWIQPSNTSYVSFDDGLTWVQRLPCPNTGSVSLPPCILNNTILIQQTLPASTFAILPYLPPTKIVIPFVSNTDGGRQYFVLKTAH